VEYPDVRVETLQKQLMKGRPPSAG
jgi:hypothetical protein